MLKISEIIQNPLECVTPQALVDGYKQLLQLQFPEDAAHLIIQFEDEILRRLKESEAEIRRLRAELGTEMKRV